MKKKKKKKKRAPQLKLEAKNLVIFFFKKDAKGNYILTWATLSEDK